MLFETNGPRFATDASAATRRQRRSQTTSGVRGQSSSGRPVGRRTSQTTAPRRLVADHGVHGAHDLEHDQAGDPSEDMHHNTGLTNPSVRFSLKCSQPRHDGTPRRPSDRCRDRPGHSPPVARPQCHRANRRFNLPDVVHQIA